MSCTITFQLDGIGGRETRREVVDVDDAHLMTVGDLKRCLVEHGLTASAQCKLSYGGVPLRVDSFTMGEYGIADGATIMVQEILRTASQSTSVRLAGPASPSGRRPRSPTPPRTQPVSPPPRQTSSRPDMAQAGMLMPSHSWQQARDSFAVTPRTASVQSTTSNALQGLRAAKQACGQDVWDAMSKEDRQRSILEHSQQLQLRIAPSWTASPGSVKSQPSYSPARPRPITPTNSRTAANTSHLRDTFYAVQAAQSMRSHTGGSYLGGGVLSQHQIRHMPYMQQQQQQQQQQRPPPSPVTTVSSLAPSISRSSFSMYPPQRP